MQEDKQPEELMRRRHLLLRRRAVIAKMLKANLHNALEEGPVPEHPALVSLRGGDGTQVDRVLVVLKDCLHPQRVAELMLRYLAVSIGIQQLKWAIDGHGGAETFLHHKNGV
eukprot:CAMPEP_0115161160 /NCGR_PEP_ID=MMETSP0227-20121206/71196_1 /TAXON_ID=89957 /ORGANISM="Polarella glacialis, Strain CCMP 1383" /LENGTH=111 /DNA_ID=CAMNT_0002573117 /DNA_START=222 /DNA_END=557 /DNA_ORIENTATION=+